MQKNRHIKLAGNEKLRIEREIAEPAQRAAFMRDLLRSLGKPVAAGRGGGPMNATEYASGLWIRGFKPPLRLADYKLVAFDMDSTLINIECVDEIADVAGRKAEVAAITEAAMRGEIADYKDSLRRRVALLAGVPRSGAAAGLRRAAAAEPRRAGLRARLPGAPG